MEEVKEEKKLSYEELEKAAIMLQNKVFELETKIKSTDYALIRFNCLMDIIANKSVFSEDFINKCAEEVVTIMSPKEDKEDK